MSIKPSIYIIKLASLAPCPQWLIFFIAQQSPGARDAETIQRRAAGTETQH